ncbi:M20 family metallo-hydrolase [Acinetobacter sp. V102_4]|uniref:M20 family metallo-hydrolase n=1 Tax=Acinetobacter sp. V102_4 TaxID=3072984 RepID=UPI00287C07A6|nr:M20 family metallo-hydrolase [Acinetobacter sp. V102_4]MDS7928279.1 M20 family metallo-hydrolase [Acinetobacter sp. V102_4]
MRKTNNERLLQRIAALAEVGAIDGGGVCRLALTAEDKLGRDLVVQWMEELNLNISIDAIGNVVGIRAGTLDCPPVMMGSHIDTVRTGGRYDGNLGVLAGLEVIESLNEANIQTKHPVAVAFFSNEEGSRFAPDMMGSLVYQGDLNLEKAYSTIGIDGSTVKENLEVIGYKGDNSVGNNQLHAFLELHIEQGPVLEHEGIQIGAVTGVQGIRWIEFNIQGVSNHAGTTPMHLRHNAGLAAMQIVNFGHELTNRFPNQLVTVGLFEQKPNLVNVIPNHVKFTMDLRNTDKEYLDAAVQMLLTFASQVAEDAGLMLQHHDLANFDPVCFDPRIVNRIEQMANIQGLKVKKMPSGAGHDAQIISRMCPAGMIFVPSVAGLSHNVEEFTESKDIEVGANLLLNMVYELANGKIIEE